MPQAIMEPFSLSTSHFSIPTNTPPPFSSSTFFAAKHHPSSAISFSLKPPLNSNNAAAAASGNFRRPSKPLKTTTPSSNPKPPSNSNPVKNKNPFSTSSRSLTDKLWLTSKLSPPPALPPVPLPLPPTEAERDDNDETEEENGDPPATAATQLRESGKIFVGNLPVWVKKHEITQFFRQFGPIKSAILIKGHNDTERNAGFGFVIYGGEAGAAENSAMKAVEFDGVEFHGRVLTVKLDDGRRMRNKSRERARWLEGSDDTDYRSEWHQDRDGSRKEFRKVLETEPENWQAVVRAFEKIKKVEHRNYA